MPTITKTIELDIEFDVDVSPGEKECRTLSNGDPGYPGSDPEAEVVEAGLWVSWLQNGKHQRKYIKIPLQAFTEEELAAVEEEAIETLSNDDGRPDDDDYVWECRHNTRDD